MKFLKGIEERIKSFNQLKYQFKSYVMMMPLVSKRLNMSQFKVTQ